MRKLLIAVLLAASSTVAFGQESQIQNQGGTTYFLAKKDSLTFLKKTEKPSFFTRLLNSLRKADDDTYQKTQCVMQQVPIPLVFRQDILMNEIKKEINLYSIQYGDRYKPLAFGF